MVNKVGIDLGTTNSVCCFFKYGKFNYIKFGGKDLLPSTLFYQDKTFTIGENARKKAVTTANHFIKSSKTYMGDYTKKWKIEDREFTPTDIATEILKEIKKECDKEFKNNEPIEAVITVPAYFTSNQIDETKKAGEAAGFIVKKIITEPIAAAIAYGLDDDLKQKLFVFDLGGGTFDVSIMNVDGNSFESLAIKGNNHLGGDDFDDVILKEILYSKVATDLGIDLETEKASGLSTEVYYKVIQKLLFFAEKLKKELSELEEKEDAIYNLFTYKEKPYDFNIKITRKEFENKSKKLFKSIEKITEEIFNEKKITDLGITKTSIDKIILVGGASYMPKIKTFIKDFFGKESYSDKDLSKLVAMGAAIIADDDKKGVVKLKDIISHSLGIEEMGGEFKKILLKNDNYPLKKSEIFTTTVDYQKEVLITVFEGEDEKDVDNNDFYGSFVLDNIEKALRGKPKIEVTFEFDTNRILNVTAKDLNTGSSKSQSIKIDKGIKKVKSKKYPYTKYLGLNAIVGVEKDNFGNAKGSNYDLAKDNAFDGVTIGILHLYTGEGFDFELPKNALKKKGFNFIHWKNTPPSANEFSEKLKITNQLWIISSNENCISSEHIKIINDYFNEGKGVYIWGDNYPYYYDANLILNKLFNSSMEGDIYGDKVVGIQKYANDIGLIPNHPITTGIENVYEGITIATIYANNDFQPLIYGSDRQIVASFYDKDGKRAIIDGGFTRLFCNWNTAGTARYVVNAAAWLANYERFGDGIFDNKGK